MAQRSQKEAGETGEALSAFLRFAAAHFPFPISISRPFNLIMRQQLCNLLAHWVDQLLRL